MLVVPGCPSTAWGSWLQCQFQRNPQCPPAQPGVIHQKCERNSTAVGVPGSEWALGGGTIPSLHSSLAGGAAELQLSSTEADEPRSTARSTGISPKKSSPPKNKHLCTSDQFETRAQGSLQPFPSLGGLMRLPVDDPSEIQPGVGVFQRELSLLLEKIPSLKEWSSIGEGCPGK